MVIILNEKEEIRKLDNISLNVLIELNEFLTPFFNASLRLETTSDPTNTVS